MGSPVKPGMTKNVMAVLSTKNVMAVLSTKNVMAVLSTKNVMADSDRPSPIVCSAVVGTGCRWSSTRPPETISRTFTSPALLNVWK